MKFITDPKTGTPSVSLSLLMLSTILFVVAAALEVSRVIMEMGPFKEFFYTGIGLYFARKSIGFTQPKPTGGENTSTTTEKDK